MKSALFLDTFREIRHSLSRFLSIFMIIALGSGFFCGIKATMPDMIDTATDYFAENNLMNYKLMSSIGIKHEDVQAVRDSEDVNGAAPGYSKDVFYDYGNQNFVLKVMSLNIDLKDDNKNYLNKPVVLEGRLPQKANECVVEIKVTSPDTFKIGNKITLKAPTEEEEILDSFSTDTYEIVGIVASPLYIGYERDPSTVGNGTVASNIFVPQDNFLLDYYSELFITFDGLENLDPFSDEYIDAVKEKKEKAVIAFTESINKRFDKLTTDAKTKIESAQKDVDSLEQILNSNLETLIQMQQGAKLDIENAQAEYDNLENKKDAQGYVLKAKIVQGNNSLEILNEIINARQKEDTSADVKYQGQLAEAKQSIVESRELLDTQKEVKIVELDRFSSTDYSSFKNDSLKVDAIAKVFPMFFILIAGLVCLTTMTRMVEEQRIQIGTYKALGYSSYKIISKYMIYASLAAILGSCLGTIAGLQIFPKIIYDSYKIMYNIPTLKTPFKPLYMIICLLVSLICTNSAVVYSCVKELRTHPSQLMRPKPPTSGKRVLLEKVGFIWKRLDFLTKVTIRNLFRYKKRFLMTIIGVAGCTALIVAGFGLKSSIASIVDKQFEDILLYDATIVMNSEKLNEENSPAQKLANSEEIKDSMTMASYTATADANDESQTVSVMVPGQIDQIDKFIALKDFKTSKKLKIVDNEVIITEKLSKMLDLEAGDKFEVTINDHDTKTLKISGIVKNYAVHYIYMSENTFTKIYGENSEQSIAFVNLNDNANEEQFKKDIIKDKDYLGVSFKNDNAKSFMSSVDSLDSIVFLLIICAGFLAIVVLYNLANINITERVREIATIKVLGFYDNETSAYIYRENIISAFIGIAVGFLLGKVLHYFVVVTAEVDMVLFVRSLYWPAYLYAFLLTLLFTVIVNIILHFKLKKVDMVESLKSIE